METRCWILGDHEPTGLQTCCLSSSCASSVRLLSIFCRSSVDLTCQEKITHQSTGQCMSMLSLPGISIQWPFQDPKLQVPTIYIRPIFEGIFPQNMAKNMVLTYLHFRILKFPLINVVNNIVVRLNETRLESPQSPTAGKIP